MSNTTAINIKNALLDAGVLKCSGRDALKLIEGAMQGKQPFTVIGYYQDNLQSYVNHIPAVSSQEAARIATQLDEDDGAGQLVIVSVIAGTHDDQLEGSES